MLWLQVTKSDGGSTLKSIYFPQITVNLEAGYLSAGLSAHFAIKEPAIFVLCYHPTVGFIVIKWLPVAGITTTSKERKQGIGPKASLGKVLFIWKAQSLPKSLSRLPLLFQWPNGHFSGYELSMSNLRLVY